MDWIIGSIDPKTLRRMFNESQDENFALKQEVDRLRSAFRVNMIKHIPAELHSEIENVLIACKQNENE